MLVLSCSLQTGVRPVRPCAVFFLFFFFFTLPYGTPYGLELGETSRFRFHVWNLAMPRYCVCVRPAAGLLQPVDAIQHKQGANSTRDEEFVALSLPCFKVRHLMQKHGLGLRACGGRQAAG